jgi:UDP-N-acetylglucosamine 2-epimerase (non-hydrolysing)
MNILHVVGARPNFMKAAPVMRALAEYPEANQILVHTGQHYDDAMSAVFFRQLEMPEPDTNMGIGSGSHSEQLAKVMLGFEPLLRERRPDLVLVYGDVNSTIAAALVCAKLGVRVGHVEAGLRSRDRTMPEEINRLLTDQLSDLLFTPSEDANQNLAAEGIDLSRVHLVGNVMIDTLMRLLPQSDAHALQNISSPYILVTLHRPSNVDDLAWLREFASTLRDLSRRAQVIFPVHPRTRRNLNGLEITANGSFSLLEPLPYLEFLALQRKAALVITDSGGIQEETSFLGIPCLTVRENTERPITVALGTNQVVGRDPKRLCAAAAACLEKMSDRCHTPRPLPLWDGQAAKRIARILLGG